MFACDRKLLHPGSCTGPDRSGKLHETIAASSHRFPLFNCQIQSPCPAADVERPAPAATIPPSSARRGVRLDAVSFCVPARLRLDFRHLAAHRLCCFNHARAISCEWFTQKPTHPRTRFQGCLESPQRLQNRLLLPQCSFALRSIINT